MYQPGGDVCGTTASPAHPLVSDVIKVRELFLSFFGKANSACLSCDCTKRAVILLSLLPWEAERGSANYCFFFFFFAVLWSAWDDLFALILYATAVIQRNTYSSRDSLKLLTLTTVKVSVLTTVISDRVSWCKTHLHLHFVLSVQMDFVQSFLLLIPALQNQYA